MNTKARLSLIVPTYNGETYLDQTLKSILNQTLEDWECIIVNDGSTDKTPEVMREFKDTDTRFRVLEQKNKGVSHARNNGLAAISDLSEYVVFMDHDDVYAPDALSRLMEACELTPGCVGAHGLADLIDAEGAPLNKGSYEDWIRRRLLSEGGQAVECEITRPTTFENILFKSIYPPGMVMVRREIVDRVGGMDPLVCPADDLDYWLRVTRHGDLAFVNKVLLRYRRHDSNESNKTELAHRQVRHVFHKTYHSAENEPHHRDAVDRFYRTSQKIKIAEKAAKLREAIRRMEPAEMLRMAIHLMGLTVRYVYGRPLKWL
ncbi:MAG: glycosyltransferase family 2 protein [Planctomycetota bacterium]|jgi:glycosyltransferase involved in cell wall biosynthesis